MNKDSPPVFSFMQSGARGESEFEVLHEIVKKARTNLSQGVWDYISGGTESETTMKRNRLAIDSLALRARVLRDVNNVDLSTDLFGRKLRLPIVLAPIGSLQQMGEGGAETVAKAAGRFGVAHMQSSVTEPNWETVAKSAGDTLRLAMFYVRGGADHVDSQVQRAIDGGYAAFCFTVDSAVYSRRERDIAKRFSTQGRRMAAAAGAEFQAGLDWKTIERVRKKFKVTLMLKGIQTPEDATIAIEHGVDWIYVSNHGGRQLDQGQGSMEVLPDIVRAVNGKAKIAVDGGFCRGTDIIKGLCAGADLVGLGRMQCYALAAGGQEGIVRMLELLEDEMQRAAAMIGITKLSQLDESYLAPAAPVTPPGLFNAFPLLHIDEYRY